MRNTKTQHCGNRHQASRVLVGLAGVFISHFSVQFFSNHGCREYPWWDLRAEINDKNPSKTHACCKRGTIYDASGAQIAVDDELFFICRLTGGVRITLTCNRR